VSTFASAVDINADLDVDGFTELDATNISETLNVVGLSTFGSDVDINAGLDVDGHTELDTLNVSVATTTASLTLANAGVAVTAILDEDLFTSNRADALATQQSIKAYVDAQVTAQDLDIQGDTGGALSIDLDSEVLTISGTASEIETSGSGNTITIGLPNQVAITTSLVVGSGVTITGSTVQVGGTITELYNGTFWNVVTQADVGYGASQVPLNQYLGQLAFLDDYHPNGLRRDGGGSDDVFVDSNGLVGINTTSPTSTLDVNGTLNVAGISTFNTDVEFVGSTAGVTSAYWDSSANLLNFKDNVKATFGDGDDLQIYHDGSHSWIRDEGAGHLYIRTNGDRINLNSDTGSLAKFNKGGSVELYYDNDKKFETTGAGATVFGTLETQQLNVSGVSTFQDNVNLGDNDKIRLGDLPDMEIYHDGSNSYIREIGAGRLYLDGSSVHIRQNTNEPAIEASQNAGVSLYYNAVKKFETTGAGVTITGIATATTFYATNGTFAAGTDTVTDAALIIEEEGSIYTRDAGIYLRNLIQKKSDIIIIGQQNTVLTDGIELKPGTGGLVKLHHGGTTDNVKLQTTTNGIEVTGTTDTDQLNVSGISTFQDNVYLGDNDKIVLGDGNDLQIYHQGTNSYIDDVGDGNLVIRSNFIDFKNPTGTERYAYFQENSAVALYFNDSKKFETTGYGVTVSGGVYVSGISTFQDNVNLGDNDILNIGDDNDLRIYHNGTHTFIEESGSGALKIQGTNINIDNADGSKRYIDCNDGGSVELYYDGTKKFETTGYGVTVSGGVYVSGISTFQDNIEVTGNIEFDNITTTGAATATLTTLTETPIHTGLSASTYRSVEYTIQATEGTNFHSAKVLVVHDGTTAYHSEYGTIYNNTPVATFNADVSGGNLRLLAAGESSNSTVYKIHFIATKV